MASANFSFITAAADIAVADIASSDDTSQSFGMYVLHYIFDEAAWFVCGFALFRLAILFQKRFSMKSRPSRASKFNAVKVGEGRSAQSAPFEGGKNKSENPSTSAEGSSKKIPQNQQAWKATSAEMAPSQRPKYTSMTKLLEDCFRRDDADGAMVIEDRLRAEYPKLNYSTCELLLKLYSTADEERALNILKEMREQNMFLSEGLCGQILSRCSNSWFVKLADAVQRYLRDSSMTSLATYKTLMKVYAKSGLKDRACDLLEDIVKDGIEPDDVMYGCLLQFAVKAGRHTLAERIFDLGRSTDVRNFIWLIKSASKRGDIDAAMSLLRKMQDANIDDDGGVYNSIIEACLWNKAFDQLDDIVKEMREKKLMSIVSYNMLIKGYCSTGQCEKAQSLISTMQQEGVSPDVTCFNCLISSLVSAGNIGLAWRAFEEMEVHGLKADNYTMAILMKLVRKSNSSQDMNRAQAVLEKSQIEVCSDEVLLNTVLHACVVYRNTKCLSIVLAQLRSRTGLELTLQSYGLVIKAYACLNQIDRCWEVWGQMTKQRMMEPSDVALSCMMEALVGAGKAEDAVTLFEEWKSKVPANSVFYSILIKAFSAQGDLDRATSFCRELSARGLKMTSVLYSTLIDAHSQAGNVDSALELLQEMEKDGCAPNAVTCSSILKSHCKRGDLESALKFFSAVVEKGVKADLVMYNTLLAGCVKCDRFALCDQILSDMDSRGLEHSNHTTTLVISMWGRRGCVDSAFRVAVMKSKDQRESLDAQVLNALINACLHNHQNERALDSIQYFKSWRNCDGPDVTTYATLIGGLARSGWTKQAALVAEEAAMLSSGPKPSIKALRPEVLTHLIRNLEGAGEMALANRLKSFPWKKK
eukprot:TRINITY_DN17781_c1_g2_i1.p1 TRINITY_DN17781_c1_g2~~TRINITY_DN17781_c1_g2_i1.p1  ORF type:complete len:870 (+),score=170.65 TRINITY_DN17781_c1_g2_i1:225-2834(+)